MADSTHTPNGRSRARVTLLAAISITILALLSGAFAESARADGDPASDVLVSQPLFLPQDAGVSVTQQAQLAALLAAARNDGYPIRVALIASRADLGSVTELWHQPQNYAQFLGQELALLYRGPLLVVMPGGFGFYRTNATLIRERAVLAAIPTPTAGTGLATAALTRRAAPGRGLRPPAANAGHHRGVQTRLHRHGLLDRVRGRRRAHRAGLGSKPARPTPPAGETKNLLRMIARAAALQQ